MNRAVLFAGMALALTVSTARADVVFTPASLPPGEARRLIDEFRTREVRPGVDQIASMLRGGKSRHREARALDLDIDAFFADLGITTQSLPMPVLKQPKSHPERPPPSDRYAKR